MKVSARMTRNTSLSMGPLGWLIVGPFILAALFPILALALAACLVALSIGLVVYGLALAVRRDRRS